MVFFLAKNAPDYGGEERLNCKTRALTDIKKAAQERRLSVQASALALGELLAATRLVEADLLALDFAGIAGHQTGGLQRGLHLGIQVDQRASNAVAHCTGLARFAAARHVDHDVKAVQVVGQLQRLAHDHATGFTREILVHRLVVDDNLAAAGLDEHTGNRRFSTSRTVVVISDHDASLALMSRGWVCLASCGWSAPA